MSWDVVTASKTRRSMFKKKYLYFLFKIVFLRFCIYLGVDTYNWGRIWANWILSHPAIICNWDILTSRLEHEGIEGYLGYLHARLDNHIPKEYALRWNQEICTACWLCWLCARSPWTTEGGNHQAQKEASGDLQPSANPGLLETAPACSKICQKKHWHLKVC